MPVLALCLRMCMQLALCLQRFRKSAGRLSGVASAVKGGSRALALRGQAPVRTVLPAQAQRQGYVGCHMPAPQPTTLHGLLLRRAVHVLPHLPDCGAMLPPLCLRHCSGGDVPV